MTFSKVNPTPIRVSTITILSYLNSNVNLKELFQSVPIIPSTKEGEYSEIGIYKIKLHTKENGQHVLLTRENIEGEIITTTANIKNHFQNQLTIMWNYRNLDNELRKVNSMIFSNGKIKAVGLQSDSDISLSLIALQNYFELHRDNIKGLQQENPKPFVFNNTTFCMINTDFFVNFKILREETYKILRKKYSISCSYEPDIYPGVKVRYYYNTDYMTKDHIEGKCYCTEKCNGKKPGTGTGNGCCKAVTICVFQSGKIIITGANRFAQIRKSYDFINRILEENYGAIVYQEPTQLKTLSGDIQIVNSSEKRILKLPRSNIIQNIQSPENST
jgi:TATA-box binding protein (TBP) (component of TFIID and TFIIIB)